LGLIRALGHALIRHACFQANEKHFSRAGSISPSQRNLETPSREAAIGELLCMDVRFDAMRCVVHARGDTVAAVGSYTRATAAESRQEDDGAEG
jgi:hypothetical protein